MPRAALSSSSSSDSKPPAERQLPRRLPIGAECLGDGRTRVRVWAPAIHRVDITFEDGAVVPLTREPGGYFNAVVQADAGRLYRFRLDGGARTYPDPASRFQPEGPHGPSEIVDPTLFAWTDVNWRGVCREGQVIYELHAGTFTPEGTWAAAMRVLPRLADLGITVIELMPIADFNGRFGWGYDGVNTFAPCRLYGRPDDLRTFVDRAHALGVGVLLDVVYNHFGPVGNYLHAFTPAYFTERYGNEWGDAINFDGDDAAGVREYFIANAGYWIDEFHLDGLRLDATQQIFDRSDENILAAISRRVREAAGDRATLIVAENEPQDTRLVRPRDEGGYGLDALWNDDFHHSAMVALTGHAEAYYSDTTGQPQELISAAKYGYLFQGQHHSWQRQPRGTPAWGLPPQAFINFLQNHDQVSNSARGLRGHQITSPGRWRAMTALCLLLPATPMLFQGQEFSASAPFLYFADFDEEMATAIRKGRREFLEQFSSIADFGDSAALDDPANPQTFERCKLDWSERESNAAAVSLHRDLLQLRRDDLAFSCRRAGAVDGSVLSASAFVLRFFARAALQDPTASESHEDDRLLIVNLGAELNRTSIAEPLLAPPLAFDWEVCWSSEDAAYGGAGTPNLRPDERWRIPGETAVVLRPGPFHHRPVERIGRQA